MSVDVLVSGGGMTGLAVAAGLLQQGRSVRLLETSWPDGSEDWGLRVSTISPASENILRRLGSWETIPEHLRNPFASMHVWEDEYAPPLDFTAASAGLPHLGHLVDNEAIRAALLPRIPEENRYASRLTTIQPGRNGLLATCEDGEQFEARLVIGADGGRSRVAEQTGIDLDIREYHQRGLVTVLDTECGDGQAWQRFLPTGPLALLAMSEQQVSVVWSLPTAQAEHLVSCEAEEFEARINAAFANKLGRLSLAGPRVSFPLVEAERTTYIADRMALIGDAAHRVHPLAGQGANLGFLDVGALLECLESVDDPGDASALRAYERWRKADHAVMAVTLNALKSIYAQPGLSLLRKLGTNLLNGTDVVKARFVEHASGYGGRVPKLAIRSY